ncbi:MAG: prepilin-type N-terminal cleavage/methylation domain-containing protein [Syntrophomonadaceae bacterium]
MDYLPHNNSRYNRLNDQDGLTLVELMVALAITVFVGLAILELLSGIMGDWTRTEANSNVTADVNIFLSQLGQDIRLAQNPNQKTKAVLVVNDVDDEDGEIKSNQIDVYRYDENKKVYQRISYLVEEASRDGQTIYRLKRGVVETNGPGNDENPQYGTISGWKILLEGLDNPVIFYDRSIDASNDHRLIEVIASLSDKKSIHPAYTNLTIQTSFMSRSQQLGT